LSQFDQIYNGLLAVQNPKLSVCGQKVSEPFQKNQRLNPSLFLILKGIAATAAGARSQSASDGGAQFEQGRFFLRIKILKAKPDLQPTALSLKRGCKSVKTALGEHTEAKFFLAGR
jgi:hypothetical protein